MPMEFPEIRSPLPLTSPMTSSCSAPADTRGVLVVAEVDVAGHIGADVVADDLVRALLPMWTWMLLLLFPEMTFLAVADPPPIPLRSCQLTK